MKSFLVIAILNCCCHLLYAQDSLVWGQIDFSHLQMEQYKKDGSAEAVVLFDLGILSVFHNDRNYLFEQHKRIKLLRSSSLERGNITIPYVRENGREIIKSIKARVTLPSGQFKELEKKDFFYEKNEKGYSYLKFAFPNLEVGAIIEYKYTLVSDRIVEPKAWYFQYDIPVMYSRLQTAMPDLLGYIYLFQGNEYLKPIGDDTYSYHDVGKLKISETQYEMWDVPALVHEKYMSAYNDYRAKIRFQLEKVFGQSNTLGTVEYYVQEKVLSSWEELGKTLEAHPLFGLQYLKKRNYKDLVAFFTPLLKDAKTEQEKVRTIYDYLNKNIEWNGYYGRFAEESLNKSFEKKVANRATTNMMLLAMLKALEIEAYPALTSTLSNGKLLPEHAIFDQFNYLLVYAIIDDKATLIDIGNHLRPMNYPSTDALNYKAWVVDGKQSRWVDIEMPSSPSVFQAKCDIDEGYLKGTIATKHGGYQGMNERSYYTDQKDGSYWKERMGELSEDFELTNFEVKNAEDIEQDIYSNFHFSINDQVSDNEDIIYISPFLYGRFSENPFKAEKRYADIDFNYPFSDRYLFELTIPKGYTVEQLPEDIKLSLPNKGGRFTYFCSVKEGKIHINSYFKLDQRKFKAFEYNTIKTFFDLMLEKQQEQIVLKKEENE